VAIKAGFHQVADEHFEEKTTKEVGQEINTSKADLHEKL